MFHRHTWGEIKEGYQYCDKCNKATPVPARDCTHKWKVAAEYTSSNRITGVTNTFTHLLQCEKCGDMKNHNV